MDLKNLDSNISCTPRKFYLNFGANIIVNVIFLFTIMALLFMLVISKGSSDIINTEISNLVNDNIIKQLDNLTPMQKQFIKENLKKSGIEKLSELYNIEDDTRKVNNYFVFSTIKIIMVMLIVIFILIIVISKLLCHKLPLKSMFIENIIIFTAIGIIELLFFKFIILKYIPVEPSFITKYLLETIKKQFA